MPEWSKAFEPLETFEDHELNAHYQWTLMLHIHSSLDALVTKPPFILIGDLLLDHNWGQGWYTVKHSCNIRSGILGDLGNLVNLGDLDNLRALGDYHPDRPDRLAITHYIPFNYRIMVELDHLGELALFGTVKITMWHGENKHYSKLYTSTIVLYYYITVALKYYFSP